MNIAERMSRSYMVTPGGCWRWMLYRDRDGYGRFSVNGSSQKAHRVMLQLRGLDLTGMEVDHLCRNRWCVNPGHLDVVSGAVNTARSRFPSVTNAAKRRCVHGHEFTPENTYRPPGSTIRQCRTCIRHRSAKYAAKGRAE